MEALQCRIDESVQPRIDELEAPIRVVVRVTVRVRVRGRHKSVRWRPIALALILAISSFSGLYPDRGCTLRTYIHKS